MTLADRNAFAVAICACSRSAASRPVGLRDTAKALRSAHYRWEKERLKRMRLSRLYLAERLIYR